MAIRWRLSTLSILPVPLSSFLTTETIIFFDVITCDVILSSVTCIEAIVRKAHTGNAYCPSFAIHDEFFSIRYNTVAIHEPFCNQIQNPSHFCCLTLKINTYAPIILGSVLLTIASSIQVCSSIRNGRTQRRNGRS